MEAESINDDKNVIIYDNKTGSLISIDRMEESKKRKTRMTFGVLNKKDEFKERGHKVIIPNYVTCWNELVDNYLNEENTAWYYGVIIEASLQCMEKLSIGLPVEDVYDLIDVQNKDCVFFEMILSEWQNYYITSIVGSYHTRGEEFCNYRNNFVNDNMKIKRHTKARNKR